MNIRRWMAWVALGGVVAASCSVDTRDLSLSRLGGDAGPDAGGPLDLLPRLEVTPSVLDLGWVTTGYAARARLTVRNTGGAPLPAPVIGWSSGSDPDFVVIQNLCERALAPGESCEVRLQVVPSRAGALQGTLQVQGGAGGADVGVAALGMQAGDLILAPAAGSFEDFGGVLVGAIEEGTFTLSNPGSVSTGPLQLGINRPEFAFVPPAAGECVSGATALEPGQACNVRLAFSPAARGVLDSTLTIATQSAGSVSLTLAGRGLVPGSLEASVPALDFEGVLVTQSARRSVVLSNTGDEPLELSGASLAPAGVEGFTITNSDCAAATLLEAGQSCSVELEFRPPVPNQEMTAELLVALVGAAQPLSLPLRGIGLVPGSLEVSAAVAGEESFGNVLVGESLERVFQVVNPGAQPSGVLDWTLSDGFEVVGPPAAGECVAGSTSLVDGQTCALRIRFTPLLRQETSGSLTVTSPLAGAIAFTLSGRGIIAGQLQADPEVNFGRVLTAASAERTVTVTNVGDQALPPPALAVSATDPAQAAAFTFQSGCTEPLELGQECTVTLTFAPTVAVPHAAALALVSAPSAPASVLLLGEALVPGSLVLAAAPGGSPEFGDVAVGTTLSRSFTLTNPGAVPSGSLTIIADDNQFEVAAGDCVAGDLVDGSSCTFSVAFTPVGSLAAAANVTVQSPGAGRAGIAVTGRGRNPAALSATGNRDLGRANLGQAALTAPENEFTWTVNNTGDLATGALVVTNDNLAEFAVSADGCQGVAVAGKASCTMTIRFRPGAAGPRTARITVSDPATMSSAPLVLTGLGVQLAGPGQPCINADCQTGECTRAGVCCDTACDRACEVCSAAGVCTPLTGRQPCGDGAACFGVDQCRLPEGATCSAVGGAEQCGSGFCQPRFAGSGDADRVCCLEVCGAGLACNAQGNCQQLTAGDGATCGRAGDLPCGANLTCTPCVGNAEGQSQCKPAGVCCGLCGGELECVGGTECGCPVGVNGQRGIPCAGGCAVRQAGACCPEAPDCNPGQQCDPFDNLCKECIDETDCINARLGSDPTCTQGVCSYPCAGQNRECEGNCIPSGQCCTPDDCPGQRACNAGTCAPAECVDGVGQCSATGVPQSCVDGNLVDGACNPGQTCQGAGICTDPTPVVEARPLGSVCSGPDQCAVGSECFEGVCCERACSGPCEICQLNVGLCQPQPDGRCVPQGSTSQDGVCRDDVLGGFIFCETREVECGDSICPFGQTCCVTAAGFGCLSSGSLCEQNAGPILLCDQNQDCPQGDVCCYDRTTIGGVVECRPASQCEVGEPIGTIPALPIVAPLCQSPAGATADCGFRECDPIPNAPPGWSSCASLL